MATPDIAPFNKYYGNGATTQFSVGFPYIDTDFVHVYIKRTGSGQEEVDSTDWEWVNKTTIRFPATGSSEAVLAEGDVLVVQRETPTENEYSFTNQKRLFPEDVMKADDCEMQILQEQARELGRAIVLPPTSSATPEELIVQVERVYNSIDNVDKVGDNIESVKAAADNEENINAAVANETNINAAVANEANINAAVLNETNINAAVANETNINAAAANEANINAAVANEANINAAVANEANINAAPTYASNAAASATAAQGYANEAKTRVNKLFTNSILKLPQDIKLELNSGTLSLKAGSVVTFPDGSQKSSSTDHTTTISAEGSYTIFASKSNLSIGNRTKNEKVGSGDTLPADGSVFSIFINTTDGKIYQWSSGQWNVYDVSLPICTVTVSGGSITSIDKVFNGFGYMANVFFRLPKVSVLKMDGINSDGSIKAVDSTNTGLVMKSFDSAVDDGYLFCYGSVDIGYLTKDNVFIQDTEPTLTTGVEEIWIKPSAGLSYHHSSAETMWNEYPLSLVGEAKKSSTTFTYWDIYPVYALSENYINLAFGYNVGDTISSKQGKVASTLYSPTIQGEDKTDANPVYDYLLAADGSEAGLTSITTYTSDYIQITGEYIILHNVYAQDDTTYCAVALYDANKSFISSFTKTQYINNSVGDVIIKNDGSSGYVRFSTNSAEAPTYTIYTNAETSKSVSDIGSIFPYADISIKDGCVYKTDEDAETGLISYPAGTNVSSSSRKRSSYIEIPENGIMLTDVFVPSGTSYSAIALYDPSKATVKAFNRAKLGFTSAGTIDKLFIPHSNSYKYVRFVHIDTTTDLIYGEPSYNTWLSMPEKTGNDGDVLAIDSKGKTFWKSTGVSGDKQGLSIGIFGGSFATTALAQTAYDKWVKRLGAKYRSYAVGGTGFVQGTKNFVYQATNAGVHDIYVIWCSTNDFTHSITIGDKDDVYGTDTTIWANFKEIVRLCYSKNPNAKVCLFTSSPHLTSKQGNEEGRGTATSYANTLKEHVEAQKQMAAFYSLPCLDQYNNSQHNGFNYSLVCGSGFHLTPYGYSLLATPQVEFLAKL